MKTHYTLKKFSIWVIAILFAIPLSAQITRQEINLNLSAPNDGDTVSGKFNVSLNANDPKVGTENGAGITFVSLIIRDANTNSRLASKRFTRRNRAPYSVTFNSNDFTNSTRKVKLFVAVNGTRRNGRLPRVSFSREFTVQNGVRTPPSPNPPVAPGAPTFDSIAEELNRLNVDFSLADRTVLRGDISAEIRANDPVRGTANGQGIARIDFAIRDAETGEGLFGTDFARGGGLGGFTSLAPPPFIINYDTRRITRPSQPIRQVILVTTVKAFVQNSQVDPSQRIQPITVIERRATIDNTATFGGLPDVNLPLGFAPTIGGVFTFEVTGENIASVNFNVETQLPGGLDVSGTDRQAPFEFTVDFNTVPESFQRGFFNADVTLTDGSVEKIIRRFTIADPTPAPPVVTTPAPQFINVSDGVLEIRASEKVGIVVLASLEGIVILRQRYDRSSSTVRLNVPASLNGAYYINVNGDGYTTMIK